MRCILIAIESFVEIDYILIDSVKRLFCLRRRASRDNFVCFANRAGFALGRWRAIRQLNAGDRRGQMLENLRSTVCKTLVPNSGRRLRNACLCGTDDECWRLFRFYRRLLKLVVFENPLSEFLFDKIKDLVSEHQSIFSNKPVDASSNKLLKRHDAREERRNKSDILQLHYLLVSWCGRLGFDLDFAVSDDRNPSAACGETFASTSWPNYPNSSVDIIANVDVGSWIENETCMEWKFFVSTKYRKNRSEILI